MKFPGVLKPPTLHHMVVNSHPCNTQIFLRPDPSSHSITTYIFHVEQLNLSGNYEAGIWLGNKQHFSFIFIIKCRHLDISEHRAAIQGIAEWERDGERGCPPPMKGGMGVTNEIFEILWGIWLGNKQHTFFFFMIS